MRLKPERIIRPGCRAVLQLEVHDTDGPLVCGIRKLRGRIDLKRRDWIEAVREEVTKIEARAKAAGCTEVRIGGRNWSRVLPDYEACEGIPNGLRKVL